MRNVIFVAPFFMETTLRFLKAAAEHPETRTVLLSQDSPTKLPPDLRRRLAACLQLDDALGDESIARAVTETQRRAGKIHRLLGTLEHLQVPLAQVRERLGIEGMNADIAEGFRDKSLMKDRLRAAGLPCARHRLVESATDAQKLVGETGFPIVLKPPAGVGGKATATVEDEADLERALQEMRPGPGRPLLAEEFIRGEEHSFDAVMLGGKMAWHSITRYYPTPLEVMESPWIQWCVLLPREVDDPAFDDIREVGEKALQVLGLESGVCHMEWFRRADSSLAISEVGARPGGAQLSQLISIAHGFDFYRAWAQVMIDGTFDPPERRYAAGAAFLRGQGPGSRVQAVRGLERAQEELGPLVVRAELPRAGQGRSSSYEGDGYVLLRHPDTEVVRRALHRLVSLVRVETT